VERGAQKHGVARLSLDLVLGALGERHFFHLRSLIAKLACRRVAGSGLLLAAASLAAGMGFPGAAPSFSLRSPLCDGLMWMLMPCASAARWGECQEDSRCRYTFHAIGARMFGVDSSGRSDRVLSMNKHAQALGRKGRAAMTEAQAEASRKTCVLMREKKKMKKLANSSCVSERLE